MAIGPLVVGDQTCINRRRQSGSKATGVSSDQDGGIGRSWIDDEVILEDPVNGGDVVPTRQGLDEGSFDYFGIDGKAALPRHRERLHRNGSVVTRVAVLDFVEANGGLL